MDPLSVASTGFSLGKSIVSIFESHPKDKARLAANSAALAAAQGGNVAAVVYLKARSGKFGLLTIPAKVPGVIDDANFAGSRISGWATQSTQADAYAKWQQISGMSASTGGASGVPKESGAIIGQVREGSSGDVLPGVSLAGVSIPESVVKWSPYILGGITILWALKYAKKMR